MSKLLEKQIHAKAEEFASELTNWGRDELLLGLGDRIQVTIKIVGGNSAVDFEVKRKGEKIYNHPPTEQDWINIFHLPWATRRPTRRRGIKSEVLLKILRDMKERDNHYNGHRSDLEPINQFFKKHADQYRISHYSLWVAR